MKILKILFLQHEDILQVKLWYKCSCNVHFFVHANVLHEPFSIIFYDHLFVTLGKYYQGALYLKSIVKKKLLNNSRSDATFSKL